MGVQLQSRQVASAALVVVMAGLILSPLPTLTAQQPAAPVVRFDGTPTFSVGQAGTPATPTRTPTPINIGNFVWDDLDHDGRQDAGEPGLANVTVQLWNSSKTDLIAQTNTNSSGAYTVIAPVPGNYRLRVILPGFFDSFSPKDQASGDDQKDSDINPSGTNIGFTDVFNLASNVISTGIYDAGIIVYRPPTPTRTPTPINIGNFIWHDVNGDGHQDNGEPGIGGVTVQLWNSGLSLLLDTDVTNSSGAYAVIAPVPGDYRLRIILTEGAIVTLRDQGDDQLDSDFYASGGFRGITDAFNLASNVISTTKYDGGLSSPPDWPANGLYLPFLVR